MNFKILDYFPLFLFFLLGIDSSGIDVFENFDECADICGLFEELQ
jgi:hypothetical protein